MLMRLWILVQIVYWFLWVVGCLAALPLAIAASAPHPYNPRCDDEAEMKTARRAIPYMIAYMLAGPVWLAGRFVFGA